MVDKCNNDTNRHETLTWKRESLGVFNSRQRITGRRNSHPQGKVHQLVIQKFDFNSCLSKCITCLEMYSKNKLL